MSGTVAFGLMAFHNSHVFECQPVLLVNMVGEPGRFPGYQVVVAEELHGVDIFWCGTGFLVVARA